MFLQVISKCLERENVLLLEFSVVMKFNFDAPDMNSACERNTVMLFSNTCNTTFVVVMIFCDVMFEKQILISHFVGRKKCLKWEMFICLAIIGNEIYIDEPDISNFCERCMKSYVKLDEQ